VTSSAGVPALRRLWPAGFAFFFSFYLLLSALPVYASVRGVPDGAVGLIIGCFAFASMVVKPWAGWATDRFGRRPLLLAGSAIFAVAALAYPWSGTASSLFAVRLLHGAGMGLYPTAASAVVADVAPPARRGEILGFFGTAANVAMAVGPLAGMEIALRLGFTPLFLISAGAAAVALLLSASLGETLKTPSATPFGMRATFSRAALFPSMIVLCLMVTYGAQVSFLPIHAHRQGMNPGLFFLAFALVVALVRGHAGRLSDRVGRVPVAVTGLAITALAIAVLAFTDNIVGLAAAGVLYGVGFGSAQPALIAWTVDGVPAADRGRAMGTYYTLLELGIAIGAMAAGFAVSAVGFTATFLAVAAIALGGAVLAASTL
jgi:MFS family permease